MNRHLAIALFAAVAAAGNAFADDITIDNNPFTSSRSQAEVQVELSQYRQAGVNPWSTSYNPLRGFKSSATRAEVVGAYLAARDEVAAMTAQDSGSSWLARGRTVRASATVAAQ